MLRSRGTLLALALVWWAGCTSVRQRRLATTDEFLRKGKAIAVLSTSTDDPCRFGVSNVHVKRPNGYGLDFAMSLNNAYVKSDFADHYGLFDAFVLEPGDYEMSLDVLLMNA